MPRKIKNIRNSSLKGVERAKKLKDLEIAKTLEIDNNKIKNQLETKSKKMTTPKVRSDLPEE